MPQTFNVGARSLFVTATAWVFIVLAALTSLSALCPERLGGLAHAASCAWRPTTCPLLTGLLIGYLPWVVGVALLMALATLASSIGLLLRLEWARRGFIGLLVVAILANLLGLWLQQEVLQSVVNDTLRTVPIPREALGVFGGFVTAARVMAVLMTLAGCGVLGWIIRRLMSGAVRQKFA